MDDLISRQAAIDALGEKPLAWTDGEYELALQQQWESDVDAIKAVPSAQPKAGRWIEHEWAEEANGMLISNYECSECHRWERYNSDFCPNCGARMEE